MDDILVLYGVKTLNYLVATVECLSVIILNGSPKFAAILCRCPEELKEKDEALSIKVFFSGILMQLVVGLGNIDNCFCVKIQAKFRGHFRFALSDKEREEKARIAGDQRAQEPRVRDRGRRDVINRAWGLGHFVSGRLRYNLAQSISNPDHSLRHRPNSLCRL